MPLHQRMNPSPSTRSERRFPGVLLAILALAAAVRWVVIDRDALWLDEGYSWWDARQPLGALWSLVPTCDPHPPLYFGLLHGWIRLVGDGTVAMRVLSLVFGLAAITVVYFAGRELDRAFVRRSTVRIDAGVHDERFGIGALAALLFTLTPFQIYFSVEARPYALLCVGATMLTLACLAIVRSIETPARRLAFAWFDRSTRGSWALLLVGALVVVWANNTAVLVLGAVSTAFIVLWIADRDSRAVMVPVIAAGVIVGVLWAPDWPLLIAQAREVTDDFWIQKPSVAGITYELHNLIGLDVLRATWWVALAIAGGLVLIARRIGLRWGLMVAALAVLPIAFNVAISYAISPILISRALMGAAPALVLALAAAVVLIRSKPLRIVAGVLLVAAHLAAVSRYVGADHVKEPWKPVIARLAVVARDAPILVVPNELVLPLQHEADAQHVTVRVQGLPADYPAIELKVRYPSGKCAPSVIGADLPARLHDLQRESAVVLLTRLRNTYDPQEEAPAALRAAGFSLDSEDVYQPGDLRVMRFVRR